MLFAPLALLLGLLVTTVLPRALLLAFAAGFVLLFPYPRIFKQFPNFTKRGDWQRIARHIEANEKPNQPIIVFQNYEALALPV